MSHDHVVTAERIEDFLESLNTFRVHPRTVRATVTNSLVDGKMQHLVVCSTAGGCHFEIVNHDQDYSRDLDSQRLEPDEDDIDSQRLDEDRPQSRIH